MPAPDKDDKAARKDEAAAERAADKEAREQARAQRKADREAAGLPPEPEEPDPDDEGAHVDNTLPGDLPPKPTQLPA